MADSFTTEDTQIRDRKFEALQMGHDCVLYVEGPRDEDFLTLAMTGATAMRLADWIIDTFGAAEFAEAL